MTNTSNLSNPSGLGTNTQNFRGFTMDVAKNDLNTSQEFIAKHIGPSDKEIREMLNYLKLSDLDHLVSKALPDSILRKDKMQISESMSENDALLKLKKILSKNKIFKNYLGMGYNDTFT